MEVRALMLTQSSPVGLLKPAGELACGSSCSRSREGFITCGDGTDFKSFCWRWFCTSDDWFGGSRGHSCDFICQGGSMASTPGKTVSSAASAGAAAPASALPNKPGRQVAKSQGLSRQDTREIREARNSDHDCRDDRSDRETIAETASVGVVLDRVPSSERHSPSATGGSCPPAGGSARSTRSRLIFSRVLSGS